jgi:glycolate oxidase iron-sulfur subunit
MGVYMEPKTALEAVGFTATFVEDLHICCGAAGTYALFQPEVAQTLKTRKLAKLSETGGKVIASGNMGCNAHLRSEAAVPVVHVVQLLDWATGGPRPEALDPA